MLQNKNIPEKETCCTYDVKLPETNICSRQGRYSGSVNFIIVENRLTESRI